MKQIVIVLSLVCGITMAHAQESKFKEKIKTKKDGTFERKVKGDGQVVYPVAPVQASTTTTTATTTSHEAYGNGVHRSNSNTVRHSVSTRRVHRVHHSNAHVTTRRHYVHVSHHAAKATHHKHYTEVKKKRSGKKYKVKYKY
jgi:hypothetical protein